MSGGSLTMRSRIIDCLKANPGGVDADQIAAAYGLTQRTVSAELKFMRLEGVVAQLRKAGSLGCRPHVLLGLPQFQRGASRPQQEN